MPPEKVPAQPDNAPESVDLAVAKGMVWAFPCSSGGITNSRVLTALPWPHSGDHAMMAGTDVVERPDGPPRRISLSCQFAAVGGHLTDREHLHMAKRPYRLKAKASASELVERFGLAGAAEPAAQSYEFLRLFELIKFPGIDTKSVSP
ncbi:hypothetical protein ACFQ71_39055 [Streptomyces sp. NPDC056534]|uniref:hypothetical protein n=1 Tax=Streptomyces sp. NPDC056534 TaxID=3345857 RepID=UPI0036BBB148